MTENPDTTALIGAVMAVSNRLIDSNKSLLGIHEKMLVCNRVLSDSMVEVHGSLCYIRDQMACDKDADSFNNIILAMSEAMSLWCDGWESAVQEVNLDIAKSKALKNEISPLLDGQI